MSALFPAAIICGIALAVASTIVLVRHRSAVRRSARAGRK
jgi:predicted Kef-type K+ transport protein